VEWSELSGAGQVWSWIVVHSTPHPYWREKTPFAVVHIELAEQEGLRMIGNLRDVETKDIHAGLQVTVDFENVGNLTLPQWRRRM
jgi:uncharacterized OB-fold protein